MSEPTCPACGGQGHRFVHAEDGAPDLVRCQACAGGGSAFGGVLKGHVPDALALAAPYYEDEAVTIYHGDCREVLPILQLEADVVITDPPFSVPVKYEDALGVYPRSWGDLQVMEPFFREVFEAIHQSTSNSAQVYVSCDDESYPIFHRVTYSIWPQSQLLVWYKPTGRRGRGWLHSHELILHLRTPLTTYTEGFRQDVVGIMPTRTLNRQHPAEKPGDLAEFLLEASNGMLILDPFMGSGTTLRAAKDLGRRAIGIEIEERYCEIAAKRMAQAPLPLTIILPPSAPQGQAVLL